MITRSRHTLSSGLTRSFQDYRSLLDVQRESPRELAVQANDSDQTQQQTDNYLDATAEGNADKAAHSVEPVEVYRKDRTHLCRADLINTFKQAYHYHTTQSRMSILI